MFRTSPSSSDIDDKFVKRDSDMLSQIYGSEELTPYWIADMDFPIASAISQAMQQLVSRESYSYEFDSKTLFKAISKWNKELHGLELDAEHFVQVPGVLSAIALLIRDFSNEGDGVLIQTPVYHQFRRLIVSAGRKVVSNTLSIDDDRYLIDFEDFERQLKNGSVKMVLLCNPHNPVGRVWTKAELQKMVDIARQYQVLIISDEIHADIVFEGASFTSIASLNYENSLTIIGSPAKNFGLNSISNGYIYSDNEALREKIKATSNSLALDHGNAFTTAASIAAYQHGKPWFEEFLAYTQNVRNWIVDFMANELRQVKTFKPEGTNQIWFDFSGLELDSSQLKFLLTQQAKLALTPGTWFGETNENYYRMNFAAPLEQIQASLQLLKSSIEKTV
ncbi:aminotransferase class I/II-fold pyridoxal phosphate-dependent enzyme [Alginatibacterium sediminis]|uniref:cysteine-S-conjugate beta-lyase n=1 Tax=Alginatibacterium sediminis TaxID=2164068 RepID=A0A420ED86_9ALTE|nr:aminotransferase class I/II-fold pyridoxal phosphate-dependent enzyme [Alginatibacterium sediminis]RKF18699.1 aminotransferase class I/II-fold pyridoxal phosphate-dependent enzyme [Alginatibacterium sediminis]